MAGMKYTYLYIDLGAILVPLIASFHPKLQFDRRWFAFWPANIACGLLFLLWDAWFTQSGIWGFNEAYTMGWQLGNLPVEEALFFVCIPYACIFSYHCIRLLWLKQPPGFRFSLRVSQVLSILLALAALIWHDRAYTLLTAVLLLVFITYTVFLKKLPWMGALYITYGLMLLPFAAVNGLLTGSWTSEPVVWYNPREIIGLRLLTIPVEDIFYGLLMVGSNALLYEYFLLKRAQLQPKEWVSL